ncbi:MAG: AI-2E family transporter [Planctomycetaceae bacterium]|nr:AI-2E family transporter [Planctomycetaceae bacterium]
MPASPVQETGQRFTWQPFSSRPTHPLVPWFLACISLLALTHFLHLAEAIMLPVAAAMVIALALRPIVRRLSMFRIPESIAALMTLAVFIALTAWLSSELLAPASAWLNRAPIGFRLRQLERKLEPIQAPLKAVQDASESLSDVVEQSTSKKRDPDDPQSVVVKPPSLLSEMLSSTWQLGAGTILCGVLSFFFLAQGESILTRIAEVLSSRPQNGDSGTTITAVEKSVSRYLLTVSLINACLGICVAVACMAVGVPNAALWGAMAAGLNFLPYLGALVGAGVLLLVCLFSFESSLYACLAPALYLLLSAIEGNLVTPAILGKSMSLNPLIVILSITYWTWLWGFGGAILAVPMLAIFVTVCRQFPATRSLAYVLSN